MKEKYSVNYTHAYICMYIQQLLKTKTAEPQFSKQPIYIVIKIQLLLNKPKFKVIIYVPQTKNCLGNILISVVGSTSMDSKRCLVNCI